MPLHELLFVSRRSPALDLRGLGSRIERMRADDAPSVTGAVAFDGRRFAGLVEGPRVAVEAMAARIATEPWHVDYHVLHAGSRRGLRRCSRWELVWVVADPAIDEALPAIAALRGQDAVDALLACLAQLPPDRTAS